MSDSIPEDAWVQCFLSSPPRPLLSSLQKRLQGSTTHINALAELYKQRAAIESTYADSLAKLAKSAEQGGLSGKTGNEWERGGGEQKVWDAAVTDLQETSSSHSTLSAILKTDFEQPLRDMPNKIVPWKRIGEQDSSLDKTLKDYEKTSAKLEKESSKKKSSKSDQLSNELNQLTQSLSSLSPLVYMTYQKLDEERLKALKEIAVRWGTMRGDVSSRDGQRAESAVAGMLGWETTDEVLAVGTRLGQGGGGRSGSIAPSLNSTPRTNRRLSSATNQTDFSPRPSIRQNGSASGPPPSSGGGGFKSLLGRAKTVARPGANRNRSNSNTTSIRSNAREFTAVDEEPTPSRAPVDADGFSQPPSDRHRGPWDDPEEETITTPTMQPLTPSMQPLTPDAPKAPSVASSNPPPASFAQTFSSSPNASSENLEQPAAPRLNLAIADAPIQESEEERQAALAKMQQSLPMPTRRSTGTARGRRDVRNTMFAGEDGALSPGLTSPGIIAPPPVIARQASASSIGSNNPFDSPALATTSAFAPSAEPGLHANMTESLNVILRGGAVQRMQINGEIHVNLKGTAGPEPIHIRLTSFEELEKIAPNPQYLSQVPDKPGEYFLDPQALPAAKSTLLFRYQGHVEPGSESTILPVTFDPRFQVKEGDTRMIMQYKSNRELTGLSLSAVFGPGPLVTNVQSRPAGGNWSAVDRQMTWKAEGAEGKIVAKFASEAGEKLSPRNVQASWKVEGSLVTGLGLEVVGGEWKFEEVQKNLQAGKYIAELDL